MQLGLMKQGCTLCPRRCGALRHSGTPGRCGATDQIEVAAVCIHRGEEPPLNPIVNIFFNHCNLQCIYCQNYQISSPQTIDTSQLPTTTLDQLADRICEQLFTLHSPLSTPLLGFVTAAHYAHQLPAIVDELHQRGLSPTIVYNSSGYESDETLQQLEGLIDIYLPDLKYMDSRMAQAYSHAPDYPEVATAAILEMRRQVGGNLKCDTNGTAYRGIIIRHLLLPGAVENSKRCLDWLAEHFTPWTLHLSLMAQYYPPRTGLPAPLDRRPTQQEYDEVCAYAQFLGFSQGWTQSLQANTTYRPDFSQPDHPFEYQKP